MAKKGTTQTELESMAKQLDAMSKEATALGEEKLADRLSRTAKSTRFTERQAQLRRKRVGGLVAKMQAKGLTAEQIVAQLSR